MKRRGDQDSGCRAGEKGEDPPAPSQHQQVLLTWTWTEGRGHGLMQGESSSGETTRAQAQVAWGPSCETAFHRDFQNLSIGEGTEKALLTLSLALPEEES